MIRKLAMILLGVQLVSALQTTKDQYKRRISRRAPIGDLIFLRCPFRLHRDNRDEFFVFSRTYGYQIANSPRDVGDASLLIKMKRLRSIDNTVTATLREGHISVGCTRVDVKRTISTMTGTRAGGRPNEVTFMETIPVSEFNGYRNKRILDGNGATEFFI